MRGGQQPWPGDIKEASSSRSRGSIRQDAPCACGPQRHRPAHALIQGFRPPQGTRPCQCCCSPRPRALPAHTSGPHLPHTLATGRSCPSTLYCSPPTPGPCSVTPAQALESPSSFWLSGGQQHLGFPSRVGSGATPLARPPHWGAPRAGVLLKPGSVQTPLHRAPRARRPEASPALQTCLQLGHLRNLPLSMHLCVHFLV